MSHDAHESYPTYGAAQVLYDGCAECDWRSEHPDVAISHLDVQSFAAAWERAAAWQRGGLPDISHAEVPVLRVLWAVQCQLERLGSPIGEVPFSATASAAALLAAAGVTS